MSQRPGSPTIRVLAGEPEGADDAARSLAAGHPVPNTTVETIADGLRTNLSDRTFGIISRHVAQIVTVTDQEILDAMRFLWERLKIVVEPSGAVGLAAVFSGRGEIGDRVGVILSGGNLDLSAVFASMAT
jgi:threonine dehydratase